MSVTYDMSVVVVAALVVKVSVERIMSVKRIVSSVVTTSTEVVISVVYCVLVAVA